MGRAGNLPDKPRGWFSMVRRLKIATHTCLFALFLTSTIPPGISSQVPNPQPRMSVKKTEQPSPPQSETEDQDVCETSGNTESGIEPTSNLTSIDTDMYISRPGFGRGGCGPIEV